jgi:polar amino acid transport system substrate-binding protein
MKCAWIAALVLLICLPPGAGAAERRPFIVAGGADIAPYQFTGSDGHATGILVHLYGECFRRLGIQFEYQTYPWARAQSLVKNGEADAMTTVVTQDRLLYTEPSTEVLASQRQVAFANNTNPRFDDIMNAQTIGDLAGLHVLTVVSASWTAENLPRESLEYGTSSSDLLVMLALNRGDLLIGDYAVTMQRLEKLRGETQGLPLDTIIASTNTLATLEFRMMVSKKSRYLAQRTEIDRTLGGMRQDGTIHRIYQEFGLDEAL